VQLGSTYPDTKKCLKRKGTRRISGWTAAFDLIHEKPKPYVNASWLHQYSTGRALRFSKE
jgi:hypothetical protein